MIVRITDPLGVDPQRLVLARGVRELLEGELANGLDDNGNGLIGHAGLSFEMANGTVTIRLSLELRDANGEVLTRTAETTVGLRN